MRQRRALWGTGALVLALHWLVLDGLAWRTSAASTHAPAVTFATRTLAPPVPAAPAPAAVAPSPPPIRTTPPVRKVPAPLAPAAPQPVASPEAVSATRPQGHAPEDLTDASTVAPEADAAVQTDPDTTLVADAAQPSQPVPAPASSPPPEEPPVLPGAIDIVPPGSAASAGASRAAPAVRIPPPMRLEFDVAGQAKKFNYSARAELLWQHDGQRYQAQQHISLLLLGSRAQTSVGTLGPTGLLPERFGDRARSEQAAHFDYAQGRVTFSANTPDAPMAASTQDRLSVFLQLGALLAAAPERYPSGTRINVATVSARAADVWSFTVEGEETLELPVGAVAAIQLERLPRRDYDQTAQVWLAPALGYLPVRIRLVQSNGDFADLRLRSHSTP